MSTASILPPPTGVHNPDFGNKMDTSGPPQPEVKPAPGQDGLQESPVKDEGPRGRRRNRDGDNSGGEEGEHGDDGDAQGDQPGSSRKRRRSRRGLDKKFECPHEGCGKSYSRAEHLYRHQLNHNPKQIYYCDHPDCHRTFVRQDLCARHKERHTARGSQLQRKDAFMHSISPTLPRQAQRSARPPQPVEVSAHRSADAPFSNGRPGVPGLPQPGVTDSNVHAHSPVGMNNGSVTAMSEISPPMDPNYRPSPAQYPQGANHNQLNRTRSDESYRSMDGNKGYEPNGHPHDRNMGGFNQLQRHSSFGSMDTVRPSMSPHPTNGTYPRPPMSASSVGSATLSNLTLNSPYTSATTQGGPFNGQPQQQSNHFPPPSPAGYQSQQQPFTPFAPLPPPVYPNQQSNQRAADSGYVTSPPQNHAAQPEPQSAVDTRNNSMSEQALLDQMASNYAIPVFGGDGISRSPFAMADDFAAWLFNDQNFGPGASPMSHGQGSMNMGGQNMGMQAPYSQYDPFVNGYYNQAPPQQHPMAVTSILDTQLPESALSEEKRQQIIDLISMRFNETSHTPVKRQKDQIMEGDMSDSSHVLSLNMMQTYITSYWIHFHPQMPILHRPTFSADGCPDLLLISIMVLGASCLEKAHGYAQTQACAELSNFMAWYLRWEIFMDADFRPPAKLWVFQALLLLEIFEKMFSTRPLHERAHIHHATTLTLMRRGSSLIGRCALDSPPSIKDGKSSGSLHPSGSNTPDEWWNRWITNEATRRAAFAAFVMDSTHATMFGHSAVMVAHEMRLMLPCDEALWSATSSAEVGRVEASLLANGVKPTTFLDGLKKTLNGQTVRTNSFGRVILMAGLLSVSWHMNQRDLQVSSLGVSTALGGRDKWRGSLTRAFDFWKKDFDESLAQNPEGGHHGHGYGHNHSHSYNGFDLDNVFEARTVLHHLAHMAMHVDVVDCQIFAGATRLLGRTITPQDSNGAQRRMRESWAPSARARDATFYALRFLGMVLMPDDQLVGVSQSGPVAHITSSGSTTSSNGGFEYSARDDFLLNRPWVLYFATLIVWSYGYALDGPIIPPQPASNQAATPMVPGSAMPGGGPSPHPLPPMGTAPPASSTHPEKPNLLPTHASRVADMQHFLRRVGGVRAPDDLGKIKERNRSLGLIYLMRDMFTKTRWELLHEAAKLLENCIEKLEGRG